MKIRVNIPLVGMKYEYKCCSFFHLIFSDSYRSPCIGSSTGHTSRDVSELSTNDTAGDGLTRSAMSRNSISLSDFQNTVSEDIVAFVLCTIVIVVCFS